MPRVPRPVAVGARRLLGRPPRPAPGEHAVRHAFTVDVEDWYQGLESDPADWKGRERRLNIGLDTLLQALSDRGVRGTFFVLGVVAEEHPGLVRKVAEAGHEIGSHGYDHTKLYEMDAERFRADEERTRDLLQELSGAPVIAFRAPFFSITRRSLWALEVLAELGYRIDTSITPVETWRYGIAGAPERPYRFQDFDLIEIPPSSMRVLGKPLGLGGAYFRIFPYRLTTRRALDQAHREGNAAVFYVHPWEYDPDHPRISFEWKARLTHYARLGRTMSLTHRLLSEHSFGPLGELVESLCEPLPTVAVAQLARGNVR